MSTPRKIAQVICFALILAGLGGSAYQHYRTDGIHWVEPQKHPGTKIVVVEEVGERHNETAIFARNTTLHGDLTTKGLKWGIYDDDSPDAKVYRDAAEHAGVSLPALVFVAPNRDILAVKQWPAENLEVLIKEVTGL